MTFRVGMKVVCIDAGPNIFGRPLNLVLNSIYTVSGIDNRPAANCGYGIFLAETGEIEDSHCYASYQPRRFRPAVERTTDISIFQKMLRQEEHHGLV